MDIESGADNNGVALPTLIVPLTTIGPRRSGLLQDLHNMQSISGPGNAQDPGRALNVLCKSKFGNIALHVRHVHLWGNELGRVRREAVVRECRQVYGGNELSRR